MERSVRDCPRRPKKPDPKSSKAGDGGRVLTAADDAVDTENGSALFCQPGGATLSFTASTEGRALCTHDVELRRDLPRPLDAARFAAGCDSNASHTLTEQELFAQDEEEFDKAERQA
eukprot:857382-Pleurochrysis_carterae.AAC.1